MLHFYNKTVESYKVNSEILLCQDKEIKIVTLNTHEVDKLKIIRKLSADKPIENISSLGDEPVHKGLEYLLQLQKHVL